ncbi:hypothetical protein MIND_00914300 [Mycena indigotica]|uniref:Glutathione S-transferase UstS-like C-terminal domain-containing protein n=1 Tax=Mycena indigotica TaxID=2126181 RepID=A0A8H6SEF7_9AGAR|nr:uncharacterized protein MIND_00914300 [Mycena indigotica]KAF7296832.1 hypothetical protein MIND_00914300 [Mycena indigotica]
MADIVFYDIPCKSTHVSASWSPNTMKTRYALNFKGARELGGQPTRMKPDGRPHYTLPMIHDKATGAVVTDSFKIACYLDQTYPSQPRLVPSSNFALVRAVEDALQPLLAPVYPFGVPATERILNPASAVYWRGTREAIFGMSLEELLPAPGSERESTQWAAVRASFDAIDDWVIRGCDRYLGGAEVGYADMHVAAFVRLVRDVLPADKWADMHSWHGGRWERLLVRLAEHELVPLV